MKLIKYISMLLVVASDWKKYHIVGLNLKLQLMDNVLGEQL